MNTPIKPIGAALPEIRVTSAMARLERPNLVMSNRWDYLEKWLKIWRVGLRARAYAYLYGITAVIFVIYNQPLLAALALAGAALGYQKSTHVQVRALASSRRILWAH